MEEQCIVSDIKRKAKFSKWLPKPRLQCQIIKHDEHILSDDIPKSDRVASLKCMKNSWMYEYLKFAKKLRKSRVHTSINASYTTHRTQVQDCPKTRSIETQTSKSSKSPLPSVTMETSHLARKNWRCKCTQVEPISLFDLNRQRLQYEKLGIPLTTEQMLSMNELNRQSRFKTESSKRTLDITDSQQQGQQDTNPSKSLPMCEYQQHSESTITDDCHSNKRDYEQPTCFASAMSFTETKVPCKQALVNSEAPPDFGAQDQYLLSKSVTRVADNVERQPDLYDIRRKRSHSISSELSSDYIQTTQSIIRSNPCNYQLKGSSKPSLSNSAMNDHACDETHCHPVGYCPNYCDYTKPSCSKTNSLDTLAYQNPIIIHQKQIVDCESKAKPEQLDKTQNTAVKPKQTSENSKAYSISSSSSEAIVTIFNRPKLQTEKCTVLEHDTQSSVELHSSDTLTDVWHTEGMLEGRNHPNEEILRLRGGLWNRLNGPDRHTNNASNLSDGKTVSVHSWNNVLQKDKAERKQETTKRLTQLREFQRLADSNFKRTLKLKGELRWQEINTAEVDSKYCRCPMGKGKCQPILNQKLLAHFVANHLNEPGIELREIYERDRLLLVFNAKAFQLGKNACMSILTYGGFRGHPETKPVFRYMPVCNYGLPPGFEKFSGHLPMLLMICRTTRTVVEQNTSQKKRVHFEDEDSKPIINDEEEELIALWVASLELPEPIYVMITVFNKNMTATRTAIIKTRSLLKSHDVNDIINHDLNHMILTDADITVLSNFNEEAMYLELSVREYGANYPFLYPYKNEK